MTVRRGARTAVQLARVGYGVLLLAAPDAALARVGTAGDPAARVVARVLGARHVVQGGVLLATGSRWVQAGGVATDALHSASMLLLARLEPAYRRPAGVDAGVAAGWAALTAATAPW